jgi:sirohydrochlorin cobaltochelatase
MEKKQIPIVMAAFGTTSRAEATYKIINMQVREAFPGHEIHWAYSSRMVKGLIQGKQEKTIKHPHEILRELQARGHRWAVVQSVHLIGGHEFHRLLREIRDEEIRASIGMPLLTSPDDHVRAGRCLEPMIQAHPEKAILLIGHGTDHPSWTAYPALQQTLRRVFGSRIFVGAVEHFPPSEGLIAEISAAGFKEVLLIPFLLVAGVHYRHDLMSEEKDSWRSRLQDSGIAVEIIHDGIGGLACIGEIFCDHIREALDVIPLET